MRAICFEKNVVLRALFLVFSFSLEANISTESFRIPSYQEALRSVHLNATRFEEIKIDPSKAGGSTLMGLIGRLLGSSPNQAFEGMGVQRYIYTAFRNEQLLGVTHASTIEAEGRPIHVVVHYDAEAKLKGVEVKNAPQAVVASLKNGKYLEQFTYFSAEDFQSRYERRNRRLISHQGRAISQIRKPSGVEEKNYFDKILRSVRYNVAFVDIAYFISRLPMMDIQSRRISSVSKSKASPEAAVADAKITLPTGDRSNSFIVNPTTNR
jgi:hypothetical protein